jgi:hypothetical protein
MNNCFSVLQLPVQKHLLDLTPAPDSSGRALSEGEGGIHPKGGRQVTVTLPYVSA